MPRVVLTNVTVEFPIVESLDRSLRTSLIRGIGGRLSIRNSRAVVTALQNVTFNLESGDRLGVLGHNGAGKSTLLKVCTGIYEPIRGEVSITGRVASMTDFLLGMDPDMTGLDNIIRRGIFMGFSRRAARTLIPEVADFSELGEYLKLPLRTFSTGMHIRLAFSIATSTAPDILVMDELIGAGDMAFFEKAQRRINKLFANSGIVILASHDTELLTQKCTHGLLLENGNVKAFGSIQAVVQRYRSAE